jgi:hypothetical protein
MEVGGDDPVTAREEAGDDRGAEGSAATADEREVALVVRSRASDRTFPA